MAKMQPCVQRLKALLESKPDLKKALEISIQKADEADVNTINQFYDFVNGILTKIPTQRDMDPEQEQFYYLISRSPKNAVKNDPDFEGWMVDFAKEWGNFLDTVESGKALDTYINNPIYSIDDYDPGASGWLTFNQFFARKTKPGKRPVADLCNNNVIVSTIDSVYQGCCPIDDQATLTAKGKTYSVKDLLGNSPYMEKFKNGVFSHSYLNINDYHRYHVPVGGIIREIKKIPGNVTMEMSKEPDGTLTTEDDIGFQFKQTRGHIIIETPNIGYVAVVAVGMAHVSSVNITVDIGTTLVKGEEFGYFSFGGSDMVLLFEPDKIEFTAKIGVHYKQGEMIGMASNKII